MTPPRVLALRYLGHRFGPDSAITPWYFAGSLGLTVGDTFEVPAAGLVLGRGRDADVRVASNGVARRHVRVAPADAGALRVEDLGSTNGTQVNGVAQGSCLLRPGDRLTLAGCFEFEVVEAE